MFELEWQLYNLYRIQVCVLSTYTNPYCLLDKFKTRKQPNRNFGMKLEKTQLVSRILKYYIIKH